MKPFLSSITIEADKKPGIVLLLFAILTGAMAQILLVLSTVDELGYWRVSGWFSNFGNNSSPLLGLSLYLIAGVLLVAGLRKLGINLLPAYSVSTETRPQQPPRFGFWLTSLGLAGLAATYTAQPPLAEENGYMLAAVWVISIGLFAFSVLSQVGWRPPSLGQLRDWVVENRREVIVVVLILSLALVARTYNLELHPYSMVNDEGEMGKGALCLLRGECQNIFSIAWASQPLVAYLPYVLTIAIFGNSTAFPVRLVSAMTGVLSVLFTYLFVRETFGKKTAWVAGVLLATFPFHLHFSRIGVDNIIDSLSSSLLLWLIFRGMRKGTAGYFLAAGIVAGLCFYTYPGSRLAAGIGVGALVFTLLTKRGFLRAQLGHLTVFAVVALITVAPIVGNYSVERNEFNARMHAVGLVESGALAAEMQDNNASAVEVIAQQFFKSSLPFIATSGPMNFFNTPRAYLSTLAAIFLMLGLAITAWRAFDPSNAALLAWFFGAIIVGSTLTAGAPSNQRMLGSSPAAVVLAAIAFVAVTEGLQKANRLFDRVAPVLLIIALLYNGVQDTSFYFGKYHDGHYFEDLSNEITYESRIYYAPLGDQGRFYLIGDPMTFIVFGNFDFFAPDVEKYNFNEITPESLAALPKDKDALFLAIPYREPDLQKIVQWLPGGQWIAENRRYQPQEPLFFAYKVSKEQLQNFQP